MKPLTPKMLELLKAMQAGARVMYMPYAGRFNPDPYYFCMELSRTRCTAAVKGLVDRGLALPSKKPYSQDHDLVLTEAGRHYTTPHDSKEPT